MTQEERRLYIKKILNYNKKVETKDLSKDLNVSEMTIRRDLDYLEKKGILKRVLNGAILNSINKIDPIDDSLNIRMNQSIEEKKAIAKYASTLINDDDIIFLDASTTVCALCPYILNKKITIVTNCIRICNYFNTIKNINIILAGGILRCGTLSLIGTDTNKFLKQYNTNKLFLSGKALSLKDGLTDVNTFEIEAKKAAMENTKEIILLIDHTKLNQTSLIKVCDTNNISKIIIDGFKNFSPEEQNTIDFIKNSGTDIIIAN
ncbi:DeoR/GlpR family DNA-binding transcription regulator [Clostridium sp. JN-1]|jgi:DeoR family myo-inositol catabolism operon transcriptional repressor|uniref:DeoR/GlpR family DNA-binding transcription regulator n=1 Tax=Clostridium sp. JN-1 TaxID=2483110 RepID=UPI000F0AF644|nr:DeoR/GlpR family DNA-binding transcription regulator [Clostridium sp. JN-1]